MWTGSIDRFWQERDAVMMKTIYVNGVVVGDVETTGDVESDIRIIREFLESKGLHREVTRAQAMFRQALSFCQTAAHLHDRDLVAVPRNGLSVVPFVVNSALSIELYLKTLHHLRAASPRGHCRTRTAHSQHTGRMRWQHGCSSTSHSRSGCV